MAGNGHAGCTTSTRTVESQGADDRKGLVWEDHPTQRNHTHTRNLCVPVKCETLKHRSGLI